ncbi:hypothetical protein ACTFIW_000893 [Dictyostelium discoideum]
MKCIFYSSFEKDLFYHAKYKKSQRSGVLYEESDLIKKAVVNAVDKKMDHILVDYQQSLRESCGLIVGAEAMHTIDVNSGRNTNIESGDVEETLVRINLESAEEIAKQLKIRNIDGLIICNFIDLGSNKNQRRVLEYLKDSMKKDSAKCTILGMSEFGLIEMTCQRNRGSLKPSILNVSTVQELVRSKHMRVFPLKSRGISRKL